MVGRTLDMQAVASIFNHPMVYEWVADDLAAEPFVPEPGKLFLMNSEGTGAVMVDRMNGTTCVVHIGALPELWGRAQSFVKEGIGWVFSNTQFTKIVSFAPMPNRAAIALGKRCGFKEEGVISKSFLKNWILHDQVILGLSKYDVKEALCQ